MKPVPDSQFHYGWQSPLGSIQLSASATALTRLAFTDGGLPESADPPCDIIAKTVLWLEHYFSRAEEPPFEIPLSPQGTEFQRAVWNAVKNVKFGSVSSYGKIASQLTCKSARAVGNAISRNPIALIVPCHRILMSNGKICGYAWGVPLKLKLLRHEGIAI